ncbi:hypothetical protein PC128_g2488 [Phytophthora cactorum]|nr:hypothetical protein PC128_g2488 [Phytophthora cactorum]
MMRYKLLTLTCADTIFASAGSANLTAAARNRNDEFLVQTKGPPAYQVQALFELLFENSVKTDPDVDLTPTKGSNHGSEPTIPEFDSQDTDGSIHTLDTQPSVDTQDTQDELHVVTPDDMNTCNGTQDLLDSNDLHVVTPEDIGDMEDVEVALDVAVNMAFQYSQTRDTILSDAGYNVYAQPDRSPDTEVSMGMQYSRMGGYDVRGAPVSRICSFPGCKTTSQSHGLCYPHGGTKPRSVSGCTSPINKYGLCHRHDGLLPALCPVA